MFCDFTPQLQTDLQVREICLSKPSDGCTVSQSPLGLEGLHHHKLLTYEFFGSLIHAPPV